MNTCDYCYAEFEVEFAEGSEAATATFCPACGEKLDDSLDFND